VAELRHRRLRRGLSLLYGGLCYTLFAGFLFLLCQNHEYDHAVFSMADGAYASVFYGLTGLHGLHVLAGLLLLLAVLGRLVGGAFDRDANPHVLFTAALWYWHFVDLVWIGLYLVVYLWGNATGIEMLPEVREWCTNQTFVVFHPKSC
jgi:cytochrome c oxidase subunit III